MRDRLCHQLEREVATPAGTFIDCLAPHVAIEIDWTEKWAESIGQSLHYAAETDLLPAAILICHQPSETCLRHALRFESTIAYWQLTMVVWYCDALDKRLFQCALAKLGGTAL